MPITNEFSKIEGNKILIVSFGSMELKITGKCYFEFLRFLGFNYEHCDQLYYFDSKRNWYHHGIYGISPTVEGVAKHIKDKISQHKYEKIIFIGVSAGGYAAILFGSLCNATDVIAFKPRTILINPINPKYKNLKHFVNTTTKYLLYGELCITDINADHHISQCENLEDLENVTVRRQDRLYMRQVRDSGQLKKIFDEVINS